MLRQKLTDGRGHGSHMCRSWPSPQSLRKAHMATFFRLPQCDAGADFVRTRQTFVWHKGVIACIEYQCGYSDLGQAGLGAGSVPIVICIS